MISAAVPPEEYLLARAALVDLLRLGADNQRSHRLAQAKQPPAELQDFADQARDLVATARDLAAVARSLADRAHIGPGWPTIERTLGGKALIGKLLELHDAIQAADLAGIEEAAAALESAALAERPNLKERPHIRRGAVLFLHLRYRFRLPAPTSYVRHEAVSEWREVLRAAGIAVGADAAKKQLEVAMKDFDRWLPPPELDALIDS